MRPQLVLGLALLFAAGCKQGSGSDIGPILERDPRDDYRLLIRDDEGRAIAGAKVTIQNVAAPLHSGRSGRALHPGKLGGTRAITVDASLASATSADRLGTLTFAADTAGDELPFVVFVPDLAASQGLVLPRGVQGVASELDDSAVSGAKLGIAFGATVDAGTTGSVTIRSGKLSTGHHPPLPAVATGARICGRSIVIDPPALTIAPAASLSVPNDLSVPTGGSADVLFLDPTNGSWTVLGVALPSDGGTRLTASGVVTRGGLYAFVATVGATSSVSGRVLDLEGKVVSGALISLGEARTRSRSDGTFALDPVAATWADGAARTLALEMYGGRATRSQRRSEPLTLASGAMSLGDRSLDAPRAGTVRLLQVAKGNRDPNRRMRVSSVFGLSWGLGIGDQDGELSFEEQEIGQTATTTSWIFDDFNYYRTEGTNEFLERDNFLEMRLFAREAPYWQGRPRGTAVHPLDRYGSGIIGSVQVTRGQTPKEGFVDETRLGRPITVDYGLFGEVTATVQTSSLGKTVVCASSFVDPDSGRSEVPIERASRDPIGSFDRHGRISGTLLGTAATTRIRATRRLTLEDWFDAAWFDRDTLGSAPRKVDPELVGGAAFDLGVPTPRGHLTAVSGALAGSALVVDRIGWLGNVAPAEGGVEGRDLPLSLRCDTAYTLPLALRDAHPSLSPGDFTFDLGVELSDGTLLDLGRGLGGITVSGGETVGLALPSLVAAGATRWLVALEATKTTGGKTVAQKTFVPLSATTAPQVTQLAVPDITAPAPGAVVSATGFTVAYTVPAGTSYIEIELRSVLGGETRVWHAVVPPVYASYTFRELPEQCAQPLTGGRSWTLTVTAARIETGPFLKQEEIYNRCTTSWVGLSEATREVNALSSTTIQVTTP